MFSGDTEPACLMSAAWFQRAALCWGPSSAGQVCSRGELCLSHGAMQCCYQSASDSRKHWPCRQLASPLGKRCSRPAVSRRTRRACRLCAPRSAWTPTTVPTGGGPACCAPGRRVLALPVQRAMAALHRPGGQQMISLHRAACKICQPKKWRGRCIAPSSCRAGRVRSRQVPPCTNRSPGRCAGGRPSR